MAVACALVVRIYSRTGPAAGFSSCDALSHSMRMTLACTSLFECFLKDTPEEVLLNGYGMTKDGNTRGDEIPSGKTSVQGPKQMQWSYLQPIPINFIPPGTIPIPVQVLLASVQSVCLCCLRVRCMTDFRISAGRSPKAHRYVQLL